MSQNSQQRSRFQRIVDWYRDLTTPETVERASKRARVKRSIWMDLSLVIAAALVIGSYLAAEEAGVPGSVGPAAIAWFLLQQRVFTWGFNRFELVAPWQFREAEEGVEADE